jgi:hypothetical protein
MIPVGRSRTYRAARWGRDLGPPPSCGGDVGDVPERDALLGLSGPIARRLIGSPGAVRHGGALGGGGGSGQ